MFFGLIMATPGRSAADPEGAPEGEGSAGSLVDMLRVADPLALSPSASTASLDGEAGRHVVVREWLGAAGDRGAGVRFCCSDPGED